LNYDDFESDFISGYKAIPNMAKETEHFAVNPFEPDVKINMNMFLEFIIFDKKNEVIISSQDKENFRE
jgi:hypothetical protein